MENLYWGILLAARIAPVVLLVPAFGGERLPLPAKLGLVATIALALIPGTAPAAPAPPASRLVLLLLKELSVGAVLALSGSCAFEALRLGGQLIDDLRGTAGATALVPQTLERTAPIADLQLLLAVLLFFAAGGPELYLKALRGSLARIPLDALPAPAEAEAAGRLLLALTNTALQSGVAIALPAALALLLADSILGFMNRIAPAVPVFFLGMPARTIVGIAVVALTLDGTVRRFLALCLAVTPTP